MTAANLSFPFAGGPLVAIAENWRQPPLCALGTRDEPPPPPPPPLPLGVVVLPGEKNDGSRKVQVNEEARIEDQQRQEMEGCAASMRGRSL